MILMITVSSQYAYVCVSHVGRLCMSADCDADLHLNMPLTSIQSYNFMPFIYRKPHCRTEYNFTRNDVSELLVFFQGTSFAVDI